MKQRIQKVLAGMGVDSKRHVEQMVLDGRIKVNGKKVRELPVFVDPDEDRIDIDEVEVNSPTKRATGKQVDESLVYIIMNKPEKVYCTNVAQGEQMRAIDLLPPGFRTRVWPVGRLDHESRGLLLLTNDGDLTNLLTHPRYGVSKVYRAVIDGWIEGDTVKKLVQGIWLADKADGKASKARAEHVKIVKRLRVRSVIDITLGEGRNRQVRRMLARLGHKVRDLTRTKIGPLELGELKPGESRLLTPREVERLRRAVSQAKKQAETPDQTPTTRA